eukprot:scaffold25619_cov68-Phaeocystis_antarctica.AAC.3
MSACTTTPPTPDHSSRGLRGQASTTTAATTAAASFAIPGRPSAIPTMRVSDDSRYIHCESMMPCQSESERYWNPVSMYTSRRLKAHASVRSDADAADAATSASATSRSGPSSTLASDGGAVFIISCMSKS